MKIDIRDFRVAPGGKFRLGKWPTRVKPFYGSEEEYHRRLEDGIGELDERQKVLYASNQFAVLLVFQAMDAAGKDSAIRHVMSGINPQGCHVSSFKQPSAEELEHDFLWRTQMRLPERGMIGIFNRSYYEEVIVVRVHPELLLHQGVEPRAHEAKGFWKDRFRSINDSESHLHRNGTRILKFFLHVSKEEQRKRLLARIEEPEKNWKFSMADLEERKRWNDYMDAYEDCLAATSTEYAPWYAVPADDKKNARLIISRIVCETLKDLKLKYPVLPKDKRAELDEIRALLKK
ncbi:MAG: phosphate--nucleotide phosphotransferase [Fibrobacteres bacterium]|nr:phosphate--nucleotide phosphotransferase [Fibrobacterota bacterium]